MVAPIPQPSRFWTANNAACRRISRAGTPAVSCPRTALAITRPRLWARPSSSRPRQWRDGVAMAERRLDPDLSITHLDRTGRDIVGPEIEGAAARQIEARVMPMTGEDAVLDAAAIERKAHMRAAVVEREDASPVINHQDRGMAAMQHEPTLGLQLGETAGAHKV